MGGFGVPARRIDRVMQILDIVAGSAAPLGVSEVARRIGVPKSSVHRLLSELQEAGALSHTGVNYEMGAGLLALVDTVLQRQPGDVGRTMIPFLVDLHDRTALTVVFGTPWQGRVLVLDVLYDHSYADTLGRLPLWRPAHCSCAGKVLLAYGGIAIGDRPLRRYTEATITEPALLRAEAGRIKREGVAVEREEYVPGITGVACAVYGMGPVPVGALALYGRTGEFDLNGAGSCVREAATAASAALRSRH